MPKHKRVVKSPLFIRALKDLIKGTDDVLKRPKKKVAKKVAKKSTKKAKKDK